MPSRPTWFWSSFFASIGVNAVLLTSSACWMYSQTKIYLPGYARSEVIYPIFVAQAPPNIPDTILGDTSGKGDAADAMEGDEPMQARQGPQGQAFLSRDPEGPGKVGSPPSMSTMIPGENGNGDDGAPAMFGAAQPAAPVMPEFAPKQFAKADSPPDKPKPDDQQQAAKPDDRDRSDTQAKLDRDPNDVKVDPKIPTDENAKEDPKNPGEKRIASETGTALLTSPPPPPAAPPPQSTPPVQYASIADAMPTPPSAQHPQSQSVGGGKPGPNAAPADPAPQSDSESDPFSKKGAVQFKRGSTDVQYGRKHKIIRPRLGLGAQTAMLNLPQPITLTLALTLDETGKVTRVDVLKSSGSKNLDQACKVAAYQWWLEPSKDKSGKAVKDVVPFVIGFS